MIEPRITVLMTVYNGEKYLRSCMGSILNQTFGDFEFLIINDCSTDNSLKILRSMADSRCVIHNNETNLGQTKSLNKGLFWARGKYIARMDADDKAFPRWLETQNKFVEQHSEFDVISAQAVVVDEHDRIIKKLNAYSNREAIYVRALIHSPLNHVGAILKRDSLRKAGGYPEDFRIAADFELWSRMLVQGYQFSSTQEALVAIRVHSGSISIQEKNLNALTETARIVKENFYRFAHIRLSDEDCSRIVHLGYAVSLLKEAEFQQAVAILQKAFLNLPFCIGINAILANKESKRQIGKIYGKRVLEFIRQGDVGAIRQTIRLYARKDGWCNIFGVIWVLSFCGKVVLKSMTSAYNALLRTHLKAQIS